MIEKRRFGRTGHMSTATIFGAAALKNVSQDDADRALELLLRYGVNHIDTAPRYGDAELRIGPWMRAHRQDFFLATKTGQRTRGAARDEIRRSLDRLRVDSVDLLQLHSLAHPGDWETAMGLGGALEAAVEARAEGLTRFIGVTGHGWTIASMHRRSLERFDFDSVLMPCVSGCVKARVFGEQGCLLLAVADADGAQNGGSVSGQRSACCASVVMESRWGWLA